MDDTQHSETPEQAPPLFMEEVKEEESQDFFLFELDGALYAVTVSAVEQVLRIPPITTVPNAPDAIIGIFHLRGRVIVALDPVAWPGHRWRRTIRFDRWIGAFRACEATPVESWPVQAGSHASLPWRVA